jgi:hypothetical protein
MRRSSDRNTEGTVIILVTGPGRLLFMVLMFAHCMWPVDLLLISCVLYIGLQYRLNTEIINKPAVLHSDNCASLLAHTVLVIRVFRHFHVSG